MNPEPCGSELEVGLKTVQSCVICRRWRLGKCQRACATQLGRRVGGARATCKCEQVLLHPNAHWLIQPDMKDVLFCIWHGLLSAYRWQNLRVSICSTEQSLLCVRIHCTFVEVIWGTHHHQSYQRKRFLAFHNI